MKNRERKNKDEKSIKSMRNGLPSVTFKSRNVANFSSHFIIVWNIWSLPDSRIVFVTLKSQINYIHSSRPEYVCARDGDGDGKKKGILSYTEL